MACQIYVAGEMMTIEQIVTHSIAPMSPPKDVPWQLVLTLDMRTLTDPKDPTKPDPTKLAKLDAAIDLGALVAAVARSTG